MPPIKSKKFTALVAVFVLFAGVILGGFLVLKSKSGSANISQQINYLLNKEQPTETKDDGDSDHDGLADWEEKIYKTDPKNPDTDQDGYLDGEETASGYDPAKKAPGDEILNSQASGKRLPPENLTRALGLKLGEAIAKGKIKSIGQDGQPLDQAQLEKEEGLGSAIDAALGQQMNEFLLPEISDSEIKISLKTGKEEAINYLALIGEALKTISGAGQSDMQIFDQAIINKDKGPLGESQKKYLIGFQNLKEIPVPADLKDFHKGLVGVFWVTNNIYEAVKNIDQDPLKTTIALIQYGEIQKKTGQLFQQLLDKIKSY